MNTDPRIIVLKTSNISEIRTRAKKIKNSAERISEECTKLKPPNNCNLYGNNLNQLDKAEAEISRRVMLFSSAYKNFEDELSKYETNEAQKIRDIKIPKVAPAPATATEAPVPVTEPKTTTPKTEPKTTAPKTEPKTTAPKTEPKTTAPKAESKLEPKTSAPQSPTSSQQPSSSPTSLSGRVDQITISSPDVPKPQESSSPTPTSASGIPSSVTAMASEQVATPTVDISPVVEAEPATTPIPVISPTPTPTISANDTLPSYDSIKDQVEIPVVDKTSFSTTKPKSSNDGIFLAGGIAAIGGVAFGAVQGVQALEKKKEEDEKEKNKNDGKFIIRDEGDK